MKEEDNVESEEFRKNSVQRDEIIQHLEKQETTGLRFEGTTIYELGGDGDCGPRCLVSFLHKLTEGTAGEIYESKLATEQIRRTLGAYRGWSAHRIGSDVASRRPWDNGDLRAAAFCFDIRIEVYDSQSNSSFTVIEPLREGPQRPTLLLCLEAGKEKAFYHICQTGGKPQASKNPKNDGLFDRSRAIHVRDGIRNSTEIIRESIDSESDRDEDRDDEELVTDSQPLESSLEPLELRLEPRERVATPEPAHNDEPDVDPKFVSIQFYGFMDIRRKVCQFDLEQSHAYPEESW
jgi:hypothetical protein